MLSLCKMALSIISKSGVFLLAFVFVGAIGAQAAADSLEADLPRISLNIRNLPVHEAVESVASQARMAVGWSKDRVELNSKISVNIKNVSVYEALEIILRGTNAEAAVSSDRETIIVTKRTGKNHINQLQEVGEIAGQVKDSASGKGIVGVTVSIISTKVTVLTDENGNFILSKVPPGEHVVHVKVLGYSSTTRTVKVAPGGKVSIQVSLHATATQLSGVVTTAVGQQRRLEVGNDITVLKVDSILKTAPVATVTDLLANRVPGLYAASTSGEPGAPKRIRIRGVSSIYASNDPIVIVDGVQVYSKMVDPPRMADDPVEVTGSANQKAFQQSPLDQIDPSTLESVEVLKGPSAVALYGSDAANGVIVITTKRGQAGPLQWNIFADYKAQFMPGKWPINYWAWGHRTYNENEPMHCTIKERNTGCIVDSLVKYQILNDANTTTFGRGYNQSYSGSLSGGSNTVTYSLTGNASRELGLMKIPDVDITLLERSGNLIPNITKRPQRNERQGGTGRVDVKFGRSTLGFTTTLSRQLTQGSPLSNAIRQAAIFNAPQDQYDELGNLLPRGSGLVEAIPDIRRTNSGRTLRSLSSVSLNTSWTDKLRSEVTAGIDMGNTNDISLLKSGECEVIVNQCNGEGQFSNAEATNIQSNVNLRASLPLSINRFTTVAVNSGANLVKTTRNKLSVFYEGLPIGATSGFGSKTSEQYGVSSDVATAGVYIGTTIGLFNRFYLPLEIRRDAGSALGSKVAPTFPRLSMSYVISDEPVFTNSPLADFISTLRFRIAYGQAGKQPRTGDAVRTYLTQSNWLDGIGYTMISIDQIGNAMLKPERTKEIELGVDVEAFGGRISLSPTVYRKNTRDLLIAEPLPPSVGGLKNYKRNLGDVRNSGWDVTVGLVPVESSVIVWSSQLIVSGSENVITRLSSRLAGVSGGLNIGSAAVGTRNIVGYPLNSRWALPIVGYADRNGDGKILSNEIIVGDSAVYIGAPYPKFIGNIHQSMTIGRQITLNAVIEYKSGLTQERASRTTSSLDRASNDPEASLGEQAHELYSALARIQTVSSTQLSSLSIGWIIPKSISSRLLSGRSIQINLQGTNLGLWTNYRGKDPNVGATAELIRDDGALPTPRMYGVSIRIN